MSDGRDAERSELTSAEVASLLGVTPRTVQRLRKRGVLRACQLTPRSPLRFRAQDVMQLAAGSFSG